MPRSPITGLVEQYNTLTPEEQKVFLDLVDPQPEAEPAAKQTRKKRARRAEPLSEERRKNIQKRGLPVVDVDSGDPSDLPRFMPLCAYVFPEDGPVNAGLRCGEPEANGVHDSTQGYAGYHEFEAPKAKKAAGK